MATIWIPEGFDPTKPRTNFDAIRAMNVEELAEWCADRNIVKCPTGWDSERCAAHSVCRECWLDWLRQEVET